MAKIDVEALDEGDVWVRKLVAVKVFLCENGRPEGEVIGPLVKRKEVKGSGVVPNVEIVLFSVVFIEIIGDRKKHCTGHYKSFLSGLKRRDKGLPIRRKLDARNNTAYFVHSDGNSKVKTVCNEENFVISHFRLKIRVGGEQISF